MKSLFKQPSAWIPLALSLIMLGYILSLLMLHGVPAPQPEVDEGVAAHLFQLWLVVEVPMILFFAFKWLPRAPKQALIILALQIIAVLVTCAPVFILKL